MIHVGEEDVDFDDLGNGRTSLFENGLEVLAALLCLVTDGAFNESTLCSEGNLTGAVDGGGSLDGLGLGCVLGQSLYQRERKMGRTELT